MIASLVLALLPLVLEVGGDATTEAEAADHCVFHLESDRHAVLSHVHVSCSLPSLGSSFGPPEGLRVLLEAGQVELPGLGISVVAHSEAGLQATRPATRTCTRTRTRTTTTTRDVNVADTLSQIQPGPLVL